MDAAPTGGARTPGDRRERKTPRRPPPRERIFAVAAELFQRDGIRAVGVDTIIAAAGVAKASFYRHFKSKSDLVAAWLRSDDARWLDRVAAETDRRTSEPDERLLVFFDVVSEIIEEPDFAGCPFLNTAAELRKSGEPLLQTEIVAGFTDEVALYLEDRARDAGLRAPDVLGRQLRLLVAGAMSLAVVLEPGSEGKSARSAAAALVEAAR